MRNRDAVLLTLKELNHFLRGIFKIRPLVTDGVNAGMKLILDLQINDLYGLKYIYFRALSFRDLRI